MQLLNPNLDPEAIRAEFQAERMVVIRDFFAAETARLLYQTLESVAHWEFWSRGSDGTAIVTPERWASLTAPERAALIPPQCPPAGQFYFAYERVTPHPHSADSALRTLGSFFLALNAPGYLQFMQAITGYNTIRKVDGAFSRYRAGHFLSPHTDANRDQVRLAAHVLSLTPDWQPEWGGNLTIYSARQSPSDTRFDARSADIGAAREISPSFNTLTLFEVPRLHVVSPVCATANRYSLFAWLVERDINPHSTDATRKIAL